MLFCEGFTNSNEMFIETEGYDYPTTVMYYIIS